MKKAQTGVMGMVILTGIVLVIISVAYLWGKPLVQKNIDKAKLNIVEQKLYEIDDAIKYTASTGSNSVVDLNIGGATFSVDEYNNRIVYTITSSVPVASTSSEVPINFYELAETKESITYNTSSTVTSDPLLSGYNSITHHTNTTIDGTFYNVSIYQNTSSSEWELLCIWRDSIVQSDDCGEEGDTITIGDNGYEIVTINSTGESAFVFGPYIENVGVYGSEPSGIISARALGLGDRQKVLFYLRYREMVDKDGRVHKIVLQCRSNCLSTTDTNKLLITRDNIIVDGDKVYTYINLGVE